MASHGYLSSGSGSSQMTQNFNSQEQLNPSGALPNYTSPQPIIIPQPNSVEPLVHQVSSSHQKGPSSVPSAIYTQHHVSG